MSKIIFRASQELDPQPAHFRLWDVGGSFATRTRAHICLISRSYPFIQLLDQFPPALSVAGVCWSLFQQSWAEGIMWKPRQVVEHLNSCCFDSEKSLIRCCTTRVSWINNKHAKFDKSVCEQGFKSSRVQVRISFFFSFKIVLYWQHMSKRGLKYYFVL